MRLPGPAGQGKPWDCSDGAEVLAGTVQFPQRQQQALPQPEPGVRDVQRWGPHQMWGKPETQAARVGWTPQSLKSWGPTSGIAGPSTLSKPFPKIESQSRMLYRPSPVPPHPSPTDQLDTGA